MTPWVQFPKLEEKGGKGKEQQMGNLKVCFLRFCLIPRRLSVNYDLSPDRVQSLRLHGQCALVAVFGEDTICSGIGTESVRR